MTTLGQDCSLPQHYNGTQINACVTIHGGLEPVCYVDNQGWQVTGDQSCPAQIGAIRDCQKACKLCRWVEPCGISDTCIEPSFLLNGSCPVQQSQIWVTFGQFIRITTKPQYGLYLAPCWQTPVMASAGVRCASSSSAKPQRSGRDHAGVPGGHSQHHPHHR